MCASVHEAVIGSDNDLSPVRYQAFHYIDVIMTTMASQITSLTVVYSIVYSGADQRKHQSSASLAFVRGIHRVGEFPAQMASKAENVSIWWRHHDLKKCWLLDGTTGNRFQWNLNQYAKLFIQENEFEYDVWKCTPFYFVTTFEVWEWISDFIPYFAGHVITYPCGDSNGHNDSQGWSPVFLRDWPLTWWRHQMETSWFSALLAICAGNSPVSSEFPAQRPVTRSFDIFFDLRLNKRLSKQSWDWWFETLSCPLWRHCNEKLYLASAAHLCCQKFHNAKLVLSKGHVNINIEVPWQNCRRVCSITYICGLVLCY